MRRIVELVQRIACARTHGAHHRRERHRQGAHRARRSTRRATAATSRSCVVNCGAIPEALIESELFGHEQGRVHRRGRDARSGIFREAEGGTVLLDEVGELPAALQVKLLRVLQERKVRGVGASAEVPIDVRVLAATNRNVEEDVKAGQVPAGPLLPPQRHPHRGARRCATGARTSPSSPSTSSRAARREHEQGHPRSLRPTRSARSTPTRSRATCASSRTSSSAPSRSSTGPTLGLGDLPREVSGAAAPADARARRRCPTRAATSTRCSARSSAASSCRRSSGRAACAPRRPSSSG